MSNLIAKLKKRESGICLYSLTPPEENIPSDKLRELNRRRASRISTIDIDGLSIYDVQEETDRNIEKRTYNYKPALDPLKYGGSLKEYTKEQQIIYLASGKYSKEELNTIFINNPEEVFILVGSPSRKTVVKTSLSEAFEISRKYRNPLGAVLIGERHQNGSSEVERMLVKSDRGVDFFVSQCVYNGFLYETLLDDYESVSTSAHPMKPVILTFSPIGNRNSLDFMKWLGVDIPEAFSAGLPDSDDFLDYSVNYLEETGKRLIDFALEKNVPIGINFESVIGRREEVLASLKLAERLSAYLDHSLSSFTRYLNSGVSALSSR